MERGGIRRLKLEGIDGGRWFIFICTMLEPTIRLQWNGGSSLKCSFVSKRAWFWYCYSPPDFTVALNKCQTLNEMNISYGWVMTTCRFRCFRYVVVQSRVRCGSCWHSWWLGGSTTVIRFSLWFLTHGLPVVVVGVGILICYVLWRTTQWSVAR